MVAFIQNANRQKERIAGFIKATKSTEANAKKYLPKFNWDLDQAVAQYNLDTKPAVQNNSKAIETLFTRYKNEQSLDIEAEGIQRFCSDIGIDPVDPVILVISKYFNASTMGIYKKEEFVSGMTSLGCDTMDKLRSKIPILRRELTDSVKFKGVYNFVYGFSRESGQRNLALDVAIQL